MEAKRAGEPACVRGYEPGDRDACRALWVDLTTWHRDLYEAPDIGGSDPGRQFDKHLDRVGPEHVWIAETEEGVVGMTGLIPGDTMDELEPLVVRASHRRRGIGAQLTRVVIQASKERGARYLRVRPAARNALALGFFHGQGFGILGQIELLHDFRPVDRRKWREGETLADLAFKV
ncbi:MAG: GNAT family N-acetyltransferase [Candidatus Thermoplasmatota archaeon]|nr:GNAT family N-acetyltransferase [Candidatus Thermoplasmatota archaeon]